MQIKFEEILPENGVVNINRENRFVFGLLYAFEERSSAERSYDDRYQSIFVYSNGEEIRVEHECEYKNKFIYLNVENKNTKFSIETDKTYKTYVFYCKKEDISEEQMIVAYNMHFRAGWLGTTIQLGYNLCEYNNNRVNPWFIDIPKNKYIGVAILSKHKYEVRRLSNDLDYKIGTTTASELSLITPTPYDFDMYREEQILCIPTVQREKDYIKYHEKEVQDEYAVSALLFAITKRKPDYTSQRSAVECTESVHSRPLDEKQSFCQTQ